MSSHHAFVAACAPDHPEVQAILAFLDQTLPSAAGDPLNLLRRVQTAVTLLLAARLESRLLATLDDDQQALPSAALIRQATRARAEATALLETMLTSHVAAPSPNPEIQPSDRACSGQESLPQNLSSEAGNEEISRSDQPASEPSISASPGDNSSLASSGGGSTATAAVPSDAAQGSEQISLPARTPQNDSARTVPDLNTSARVPTGRPRPGTGLVVSAPKLAVPPRDRVRQPPEPGRKTGQHIPTKR